MKTMEMLKGMLCDELDKIVMAGELNAGSLDTVDKLTHAIKSTYTIMAMEESEYSNDGSYDGSYEGGSYARGRGQNARRDSMGRYSRARRGYSRDEKEEMSEVKEALKRALNSLE